MPAPSRITTLLSLVLLPSIAFAGTGDVTSPPRELAAWDQPPHRQTVYLNFVGGPLSYGEVAAEMQATCILDGAVVSGFNRTEKEAFTYIQAFQHATEPYGLRIVYETPPPKHLPYTMVMVGGTSASLDMPGGLISTACSIDCGDQWWRDTLFSFTNDATNIKTHANAGLSALGHAWGLDALDDPKYIMYPYSSSNAPVWSDTCAALSQDYPPTCATTHKQFCPDGGQNDVAELMAYFGANSVDDVPPTVTLTSPVDGAMLSPGDTLVVEVDVTDNFEGVGWRLMVPELGQELPAYQQEKSWSFPGIPKGTYTIRVEAIDHDRNVGSAEAKIYVGVEPEPGTTGDMSTGEEPTTGATGSGGSSGDASAGTTPEMDGDDAGCNCATGPVQKDMPLGLLALAGLGLARRRRR